MHLNPETAALLRDNWRSAVAVGATVTGIAVLLAVAAIRSGSKRRRP